MGNIFAKSQAQDSGCQCVNLSYDEKDEATGEIAKKGVLLFYEHSH